MGLLSVYSSYCSLCDRLGRSRILSPKSFQYFCAFSGFTCAGLFFLSVIIAGILPPMKASWTPEETTKFMSDHHQRINVGNALLVVAGAFWIPLSIGISAQLRRIPNLPWGVPMLQLGAGVTSVWAISLPGVLLAVANFDLERPVEITQALVQLFWISLILPWPTFFLQSYTMAYALILDTTSTPIFPKWMILVNTLLPLFYIPSSAVGVTRTGPFSFNGVFGYWFPGFAFGIQAVVESACLAWTVWNEVDGGVEKSEERV